MAAHIARTLPDGVQEKPCSKCRSVLPIGAFNRKAGRRFGRADCRRCQNASNRAYAKANPEKIYEKTKAYREANPEKTLAWSKARAGTKRLKEYSASYRAANREKLTAMGRAWRAANPGKRSEYNARYTSTPKGKLSAAIRASIRSEIHFGSKGGRKTFDLLGYSPSQLMRHLESHFLPGMTWENYGRGGWHVDHRIPLSAFNYESPDHQDFKRAWALENLQPMWEAENLSKGRRLAAPFQPSLLI